MLGSGVVSAACVIHLGLKQGSAGSGRCARQQGRICTARLAGARVIVLCWAQVRVLEVPCACAELKQAKARHVRGQAVLQ